MNHNNRYNLAVIGGGPSGVEFIRQIRKKGFKDSIILIEKEKLFSQLFKINRIVKNKGSNNIKKIDIFFKKNKSARALISFLKKNIGRFDLLKGEVIEVCKNKSTFIIFLKSGEKIYCDKLILAVGIHQKELKINTKNTLQKSNLSQKSFDFLSKIDFSRHDLVCVGSGESMLLKILRLVSFLKKESISFNSGFIKLIIKNNFNINIDKKNLHEIQKLEKEGIVKIYKSYSKITNFSLNRNKLINKILGSNFVCDLKNKNGAYILIHIGYAKNEIKLTDIKSKDFISIGDFSIIDTSNRVSIQSSILNARKKASLFIKSN